MTTSSTPIPQTLDTSIVQLFFCFRRAQDVWDPEKDRFLEVQTLSTEMQPPAIEGPFECLG